MDLNIYPNHINKKICVQSVNNCNVAWASTGGSYVCEDYYDINFDEYPEDILQLQRGCNTGYTLKGSQCSLRALNCKQHDNNGLCIYC